MIQWWKVQSALEAKLLGVSYQAPFWFYADRENFPGFWAVFMETEQALFEAHWGGSGTSFFALRFCQQALREAERRFPGVGFFSHTPVYLPKALKMAKLLGFQAQRVNVIRGIPCLLVYRRL